MYYKMDDVAFSGLGFKELILDKMCPNPAVQVLSKRGGGKSTIIKALLQSMKDYPVCYIISMSEKFSPFFSGIVPDCFIWYKFETTIIKKLLLRQREIIKLKEEKKKEGKFIDSRVVIVMDDCLADVKNWKNDPYLTELMLNGRHYNISLIMSSQDPLGLSPLMRNNMDYVFILASDSYLNRKKIFENYCSCLPDRASFERVFAELTENYCSLVVINRGNRKDITDKIAWYKAPDLKNVKFSIGCSQYKNYHKYNYNEKWDEEKQKVSYEEYLAEQKKNKEKIKITKI